VKSFECRLPHNGGSLSSMVINQKPWVDVFFNLYNFQLIMFSKGTAFFGLFSSQPGFYFTLSILPCSMGCGQKWLEMALAVMLG